MMTRMITTTVKATAKVGPITRLAMKIRSEEIIIGSSRRFAFGEKCMELLKSDDEYNGGKNKKYLFSRNLEMCLMNCRSI